MNAPIAFDATIAPATATTSPHRRPRARVSLVDRRVMALQAGTVFEFTMHVLATGIGLSAAAVALWVVAGSVFGVL